MWPHSPWSLPPAAPVQGAAQALLLTGVLQCPSITQRKISGQFLLVSKFPSPALSHDGLPDLGFDIWTHTIILKLGHSTLSLTSHLVQRGHGDTASLPQSPSKTRGPSGVCRRGTSVPPKPRKCHSQAVKAGDSLLSHNTSTLDVSPQRYLGPYLGEINRNLAV